jgi:hypothetical protein
MQQPRRDARSRRTTQRSVGNDAQPVEEEQQAVASTEVGDGGDVIVTRIRSPRRKRGTYFETHNRPHWFANNRRKFAQRMRDELTAARSATARHRARSRHGAR